MIRKEFKDLAGTLAGGLMTFLLTLAEVGGDSPRPYIGWQDRMDALVTPPLLIPPNARWPKAEEIGFRFGARGTHSSRTMMLGELRAVLGAAPATAKRSDYATAVIDGNCLSKPTISTRRLTNQRLGELYGLDPSVALFRVLRRLWDFDSAGRPLLAILAALARDPLLAATFSSVVLLPVGAELQREPMKQAVRTFVAQRMNDSTIEKVCRNAASTWAQSGHLEGRTFKKRRAVTASPATVAFAMYLAHAIGFGGAEIFSSSWLRVLDCDPSKGRQRALEAKRIGLIDLRLSGDIIELNLSRLDPNYARV